MELSSLWLDLTSRVEKEQSAPVFSHILKKVRLSDLQENSAVLSCENRGILIFLENKRDVLETLLFDILKRKINIVFKTEKKRKKTKAVVPLLKYNQEKEAKTRSSGLQTRFTFEGFAVSSSNQIAYEAAKRVSSEPGQIFNPLFIYGGVGCGKTHIIQAVGNRIMEKEQGLSVLYCTSEEFTNDLIENIKNKSTHTVRKKYRKVDILIIDDVQFIAGKNYIQEEFYHTFNTLIKKGSHVILSSDKPPSQINKLEDRLKSRFSGGLTIDIQKPDFELRCAILLIKAKERKINIEMEAIKTIAETTQDTRELEGRLLELYAKTLSDQAVITEKIAKEQLQKKQDTTLKEISTTAVLRHVCLYFNLKPYQLKEKTRIEKIARPRQIAMYILRKKLNLKYEEIAFHLKRNDHTTIMHGVNKIEQQILKSNEFRIEIEKIINTL